MFRFLVPALLVASPAAAQVYVKASVGQTMNGEQEFTALSDEITYGGAIGTRWHFLRGEIGARRIEVTGFADAFGHEEINLTDFSATAFVDLPVTERASVFVGAGLDYLDGEFVAYGLSDGYGIDGDGWHWATGGAYSFSDHLTGEVQFRRVEADTSLLFDDDLSFDELTLGLRVGF